MQFQHRKETSRRGRFNGVGDCASHTLARRLSVEQTLCNHIHDHHGRGPVLSYTASEPKFELR